MDIGVSLTITLPKQHKDEEQITYRSKIIDRNDSEIIIDYPVDQTEYIELPIRTNSTIGIEYIAKGSVYKFQAKVTRLIDAPIMSFAIDMPEKDEITRIQRRQYVRINIDVDVAVHYINSTSTPFTTVTNDISGGGASIVVPNDLTLSSGEIVQLYIVLRSKYSPVNYIKTKAEVIRTTVSNEVRRASLKFQIEDEKERQDIIRYCFEVQREKLKRQVF